MIYTVTLNPALDYVMRINRLITGETNRSERETLCFGGKGINVSLVLRELGVASVVWGFSAGFTGAALEAYLRARNVQSDLVLLKEGLTRINVKLKAEEETEINAGGPPVDPAALKALFAKTDALKDGDTLVLAGSVPNTLSPDVYEQILHRLEGRRIRVAADTTGEALRRILPYRPFLIKPNRRELEELASRPLAREEDLIDAARALQAAGAENVLVSLGKDGAILLDENGSIRLASAARGRTINTVGAGDSMLAGFLAGAEKGYDYALKLGSACGAATAFSEGLAVRAEIDALME